MALNRTKRKKRKYKNPDRTTNTPQKNPYFRKDEKSWFEREVWVLISILVVTVVGVSYVILYSPFLRVDEINIEGNERLTVDELQQITESYRSEKVLYLFPRSAYILFSPSQLEDRFREQIANRFALKTVEATKDIRNGVSIRIEERIPGVAFKTGGYIYYLDEFGVVTTETTEEAKDPEFSVISDTNSQAVTIDQQVISEDLLNLVLDATDTIPEKTGMAIKQFEIPPLVCKEFVTEAGLFDSAPSPDTKEREREIQERVATGELSIEESLEALETLDDIEAEPEKTFTVRRTSNPVECNYVNSLEDIVVVLDVEGREVRLYTNTLRTPAENINTMNIALAEAERTLNDVQYVDLRFEDRVYLK